MNRRNDQRFVRRGQLTDEAFGAVGAVDAAFAEAVEFAGGLVVEIGPIDDEEDFVDQLGRELGKGLRRFKAGQCLPTSSRVLDIAVFVGFFDPLDDLFDSVVLIRPEHHQYFVGLVQNDVFADHFGEVTFL